MQKTPKTSKHIGYYLSRIKDTHTEDGKTYITLFARLSIKTPGHHESILVEIDEVAWNQASRRLQKLPNGAYNYRVSKAVFLELERITRNRFQTLYYLTPLYQSVTFKKLG